MRTRVSIAVAIGLLCVAGAARAAPTPQQMAMLRVGLAGSQVPLAGLICNGPVSGRGEQHDVTSCLHRFRHPVHFMYASFGHLNGCSAHCFTCVRSKAMMLLLSCLATSVLAGHDPAITVTLLGTGDPVPRIDRFGPSTLVQAGGHTLLFDAGRGTLMRLRQSGVSSGELDAIFLTHLHSDHVVGLVDLWLSGWVADRRTAPLRVYGPPGTRAMVNHLRQAFDYDIRVRTEEAGRSPAGVHIKVVEIEPGQVWARDGVIVRAFDVDHRPVVPAYGFRIDHAGHAVALSGDTRPSKSLVRNAQGVDLLVHEVAEAPQAFKRAHPHLPRLQHHTQAIDAGRVFAAVKPKWAVFSHLVLAAGFTADQLLPLVHRTYAGRVLVGEDLMRIEVGDTVQVHRATGRSLCMTTTLFSATGHTCCHGSSSWVRRRRAQHDECADPLL